MTSLELGIGSPWDKSPNSSDDDDILGLYSTQSFLSISWVPKANPSSPMQDQPSVRQFRVPRLEQILASMDKWMH